MPSGKTLKFNLSLLLLLLLACHRSSLFSHFFSHWPVWSWRQAWLLCCNLVGALFLPLKIFIQNVQRGCWLVVTIPLPFQGPSQHACNPPLFYHIVIIWTRFMSEDILNTSSWRYVMLPLDGSALVAGQQFELGKLLQGRLCICIYVFWCKPASGLRFSSGKIFFECTAQKSVEWIYSNRLLLVCAPYLASWFI